MSNTVLLLDFYTIFLFQPTLTKKEKRHTHTPHSPTHLFVIYSLTTETFDASDSHTHTLSRQCSNSAWPWDPRPF
ncbi:hypothetical protein BCV70DRAFT_82824 [Testicularia cyperi]|uniref:Uncharacterized protein n=1 Tax=Testicularia cyperi TaxID=1882483 RepID=A0A317XGQ9_9BASI|nr:hypothetical protein BCV70DRAFT_82824 [Testicularia cyperi]